MNIVIITPEKLKTNLVLKVDTSIQIVYNSKILEIL